MAAVPKMPPRPSGRTSPRQPRPHRRRGKHQQEEEPVGGLNLTAARESMRRIRRRCGSRGRTRPPGHRVSEGKKMEPPTAGTRGRPPPPPSCPTSNPPMGGGSRTLDAAGLGTPDLGVAGGRGGDGARRRSRSAVLQSVGSTAPGDGWFAGDGPGCSSAAFPFTDRWNWT
jgi:hypothetical protein